ncbi:MAG: DUF4249 family protein [Bacteroidales bacterium]|nr:DUF4249 family protein [Bacteroidales bacterium]
MKLRQLFIFLVLGCCLSGCDYYFYPEGLDNDSKLYVQCIAGNGDRTYINIQKAMGINSVGDIMPEIESVSLKVNGKESHIEKYVPTPPDNMVIGTKDSPPEPFYPGENSDYYILRRYNIWYTDAAVKEGDDISLEVKAKGMQEVSATSKVPERVVIKEIKAAPRCSTVTDIDYSYKESFMSFDISLEDYSPDDYYGVTVEQEQETVLYYDDGRTESYSSKGYGRIINWNSSQSDIMAEIQASDGPWTDAQYNGYFIDSYGSGSMKLLPGSYIKDGHLQFDCDILFSEDSENTYSLLDEDTNSLILRKMTIKRDSKYKVLVYRVSPEFYRFNKAQSLQSANYLAEYGLSPATFSYTNVKGGFGVLAAVSFTSTPWYPAPFEPEQ